MAMAHSATLHVKLREAVVAYQGGYISIGRLAKAMDMHSLELRTWLAKHDIPQNVTSPVSRISDLLD
jgi:hypothetical protein